MIRSVVLGTVITAVAAVAAVPALASGQAKRVVATLIARQPQTVPPGTSVSGSEVHGTRVFVDPTHGFALVTLNQAQYPAATADGGRTWHTDGPALHVDAAQAPLDVTMIGALNRRTIFAYGQGSNTVDVTSDGGRHWYRALWGAGTPVAVFGNFAGHLVAVVDLFGAHSSQLGPTWQYVSSDGGRIWTYSTVAGAS